MSQIKQPGLYRGIKVDGAIGPSSGGHTQLVAQLVATECYDSETGEWVEDWQQYDEQYGSEITAYLMLFSKDTSKEAFQTAKQLQQSWGWDGVSLLELEHLEPEPFQFRVIENEYDGKTRLKVNWISPYDAEPGSTLKKLSDNELKQLDAKYANALRKLSGGPKPKSVPRAEKPEKPPVPGTTKAAAKAQYDERAARGEAAEKKVVEAEKPKPRSKPKPRPEKPATPKLPTTPAPEPEVVEETPAAMSIAESLGLPETCDQQEAWGACYKHKAKTMTDVQIGEIWISVIEDLGGEEAVEDWATVRDIVIEKVR